jgi:hypothetical protein
MAQKSFSALFTVIGKPASTTQERVHGLVADAKEQLLDEARGRCPKGMELRTLWLKEGRKEEELWSLVPGRSDDKCWRQSTVLRAFGD